MEHVVRTKTLSSELKAYLIREEDPQSPRHGPRKPLGSIAAFGDGRHLSEVGDGTGPGMFLLGLFAAMYPEAAEHEPAVEVSEIDAELLRRMRTATYPGVLLDLDMVRDAEHAPMMRLEVSDFTGQWSRRQIGWYYATDEALADWNVDRVAGRNIMVNDLRAYQEYLNGNVYAMVLMNGALRMERCGNIVNTSLGDKVPSDGQLNRVLEHMAPSGVRHLIVQRRWMPGTN